MPDCWPLMHHICLEAGTPGSFISKPKRFPEGRNASQQEHHLQVLSSGKESAALQLPPSSSPSTVPQ